MQESLFGNPSPPVHEFPVHYCDLAGRAAERYKSEFYPKPECLAERDLAPRRLKPRLKALAYLTCCGCSLFSHHWLCQSVFLRIDPAIDIGRQRSDYSAGSVCGRC